MTDEEATTAPTAKVETRGGARKGAGRKPGAHTLSHTEYVRLTEADLARLIAEAERRKISRSDVLRGLIATLPEA